MAELKRVYNVPLRREWLKAPHYKRAKKAVTALKQFLAKHMKSDNIKIGRVLNQSIWVNGIKNPPHHVKIVAIKGDDGMVKVELEGFEYVSEKKEQKEEKTKVQKAMEKLGVKSEKPKKEEVKTKEKPADSVKTEKPKTEEKKIEPAKKEVKVETAKTEEKKIEPAKKEVKVETAKTEEPKVEKTEEPKTEADHD